MADIGNIVNVTVDRQTSPITVAGFGLPMFLGLHRGFTERYREYSSASAVGQDFSTTSPEYKAAQAFFGQAVSINKIAIGRRDSGIVTYTPVVANSQTYSVTLNGTLFSIPSDVDATATEIVTALTAAINGGSEPVTASGTTTLILTADVVGVPFSVKATTNLTPVYTPSAETITEAFDAVKLENNDWYGMALYSHVKADQLEAMAWSQANLKLFGTSSSDTNIVDQSATVDVTSIASAAKAASYDRSFIIYSADAASYPECALFGGELARDAGKATWAYKTLRGITVDNLTETQRTNALAKNCNVYISYAESSYTEAGKTCEGTFIDIIRDIDQYKSDIQVAVISRFFNLPKVPQTEVGAAIIQSELIATTRRAINSGILADDPAPVIFVPKVLDISTNDRANRILPDITITARIQGAFQYADIAITVTV